MYSYPHGERNRHAARRKTAVGTKQLNNWRLPETRQEDFIWISDKCVGRFGMSFNIVDRRAGCLYAEAVSGEGTMAFENSHL